MYQKRRAIELILILMFDLLAMVVSFTLSVRLRYGVWGWAMAEGDQRQQIIIMVILYIAINMLTNYYSEFFSRNIKQEFWAVLKEEAVFYITFLIVYFLIHSIGSISRLMTFYLVICQTALTFLFRILLKKYMLQTYKRGRSANRMVLVSTREEAADVIRSLKSHPDWNSILVGVILLGGKKQEKVLEGVPVVAGEKELIDYIIHHNVDEVFFTYSGVEKDEKSINWIREIQMTGILVDVNIGIFNIVDNGTRTLNRVGNYSVVSFARNVISTRGMIIKRFMDIIGGMVGMILFGISAVILVPIIRLDSPGPALFSQVRIGRNGRKFKLYKYRSMYTNAEALKTDLAGKNEMSGPMFKIKDDPRITRVGRWLRKTSLDELPQFWNVLKGDMSLVGTRPPTEDEFEQYTAMHKARLSMTPGLTGIWQISGRSDIKDFDEILQLDMQYIDNWSVWLDIQILLQTVPAVLFRRGAK